MAQKPPKLLGLIAIVLIATAGTGAVVLLSKKSETSQTSMAAQTADSVATATTGSTTVGSTYKDGRYTADGGYNSPDGAETIGVTVTLKSDIVTSVSVDTSQASGDAAEYQAQFASGYKQYVVGKNIASISLSRISGSSLTSTGFNNALAQIESQAKAA